jgi:hypothetical protein
MADRLVQHRNPGEPQVQRRSNGRWVMVSERRTDEGGTVAVYSDITELKQREQDLTEKSAATAIWQSLPSISRLRCNTPGGQDRQQAQEADGLLLRYLSASPISRIRWNLRISPNFSITT